MGVSFPVQTRGAPRKGSIRSVPRRQPARSRPPKETTDRMSDRVQNVAVGATPMPISPTALVSPASLTAPPGAVVVVVPTYNERENLPVCVERILALGARYRVVIVDDNSPDGTGKIADALARLHAGRIDILHRSAKLGLGPAYVAGLGAALATAADHDLIATMDADLSHDPADLPRLVAAVECGGLDLALGSRYVAGGGTSDWPLARRLLSRCGGRYAALILGLPVADPTSGFKLFRPRTLRAIDVASIGSDGYVFNIEITHRALRRGCRLTEVPICFADRVAGRSKLSRRIMLEAAVQVWRLRFRGGAK